MVVKFLPDDNVRFLELKKGSVNFVLNGVDPHLLPAVLENGRLVMEEAPGSNASVITSYSIHYTKLYDEISTTL